MNTLIAESLGAVYIYIYIYIVYLLKNRKENNMINKKIVIEA